MKKIIFLMLIMVGIAAFSFGAPVTEVTSLEVKNVKAVTSLEQLGKIYLMWTPAERVFAYNIYRDGEVIGRARDPFYVDNKANPGQKYTYKVTATKQGKEGPPTKEVSVVAPTEVVLSKRKVEVRGDDLYVDGQKFIVCGIGYTPYRPFLSPEKNYPRDYNLIELDFKRLRDAGFNTIRNWSGRDIDEYMMELAAKYGLMIMQGISIWLPPLSNFSGQTFIENALTAIEDEVKIFCSHSNILCYLVMNEPPTVKIATAGIDKANGFFKMVTEKVKELDPQALVSMSNFPRADFLDTSIWDIVCMNHYRCDKSHIQIVGYRGYVSWMKRSIAKNKPLIITEYGYSVSARGEGNFGYGGNTPEIQAQGLAQDISEAIYGGAIGGCIFSWMDEWWKNAEGLGDETRHENEPEEWFGIIEFNDTKNLMGEPRPAYEAMHKLFDCWVISPRDSYKVQETIPIEIYSDNQALTRIKQVEYSWDSNNWRSLNNSGNWWTDTFDTKTLPNGKYSFLVRYTDMDTKTTKVAQKVTVFIRNNVQLVEPTIEISTDKKAYKNGETIITKIKLNRLNKPLANTQVEYCLVQSGVVAASCRYLVKEAGVTDKNGQIQVSYQIKDEDRPHFIIIAAAVPSEIEPGHKFGERIWVQINPVIPSVK